MKRDYENWFGQIGRRILSDGSHVIASRTGGMLKYSLA